jgi:hypothetical protein
MMLQLQQPESTALGAAQDKDKIDQLLAAARTGQYPNLRLHPKQRLTNFWHGQAAHAAFGGSDTDILPIDADVPRAFTGDQLLRSVEANAELLGVSEYVETMLMRIRTILSDSRMKTITSDTDGRDAA